MVVGAARPDVDVVVIGAGFGGLTMLYRLRELGFSMQGVEAGDGVGGTWFWNRYPGARVDVQSVEYSLSISKEVQDEWTWTELMAPQEELERYVNFVADRLDLRRHIKFETRVTAMTWDEESATWLVETDQGDAWRARFVVTAVGCLSSPLEPAIKGLRSFAGVSLYTNRFPKEGFDFTGKRVGLIGTGSSGVQATPVIARQARRLWVFQRSAAYTMPAGNRPWAPGEFEDLRENYDEIRARQHASPLGAARFGAVAIGDFRTPPPKILETPMEARLARLDRDGWLAASAFAWADVALDIEANRAAQALYAELIRREVKDPQTAAALVPHYPMGCKRPIIDIGYFETFNRDNVSLVDLRKGAIQRITPDGIETAQGSFPLDVIVFATGFDAMTGSLNRIDIRGRDGRLMRDTWLAEGPRSYLGLTVAGFPNLFTITGPGSPSVLTNMISSIEQHSAWIGDCLGHMRERGLATIDADPQAQDDWVAHVAEIAQGGVRVHESCTSWYLGANVPGKVRVYMPYAGGLNVYRDRCDAVVREGYAGFALA
ncbi:MAG TPA: NAD(P)/FAD-dependent oxidoreductase [Caulobacteraceae bacterium]|jgi:cation diffusion facilitator CzcD-associated flavoprotein CzcO